MSHELGHYFDLHYSLNITEKILIYMINNIDLSKYKAILSGVNNNLSINEIWLKGNLPMLFMRQWIKEVVADIIGIALYGVASYFVGEHLASFLSDFDNNKDIYISKFSPSHPRNSFRNKIKIMYMDKSGYFDNLSKEIKEKIHEYEVN